MFLGFTTWDLSKGNALYTEWKLHPAAVDPIWIWFGYVAVDLIPSRENSPCPRLGADFLSRGNPLYAWWKLHPAVVDQFWTRFSCAAVILSASEENSQCPLFFFLHYQNALLRVDVFAQEWLCFPLYMFPPTDSDLNSFYSEAEWSVSDVGRSSLAVHALAGGTETPPLFCFCTPPQ